MHTAFVRPTTAYPYLVTLRFECWGLVVRPMLTPPIDAAIPWMKTLTSSVRGMDNVPCVHPCASRDEAWDLARALYKRFACGGSDELHDFEGIMRVTSAE